ncbi:MAG: mechanosensitive ion channel family protein [Candidatus Woesearchaeota archaeon]
MNVTFIAEAFDLSTSFYDGFLFNLILAAIVLLVGFVIGRMAGKLVQRVLGEIELNHIFKNATGKEFSLEEFVASAVMYLIYFFVIVMALNQLGLTTTILYIISSGIILIVIVSFLLGVRDFIPNMFAGLSLQKKGFLKVGDKIRYKDIEGKIEHLNLVETRLITKDGDVISIPNSVLVKHEIIKKN